MPLTPFQSEVLTVIAANRSEESHFAGGVVLNAAPDSARFSHDFDIFHEAAEEVARASDADYAEAEMTRLADTQPDLPIGVAFVDAAGKPGWIGDDPALKPHAPSIRGCLPHISGL